jgi:hypothetical protein
LEAEEYVVHNGIRMTRDWARALVDAQRKTHYRMGGKVLPRIPFGQECGPIEEIPLSSVEFGRRPCRFCGTLRGQLHDTFCVAEECPACGGWITSCMCFGLYDDDDVIGA